MFGCVAILSPFYFMFHSVDCGNQTPQIAKNYPTKKTDLNEAINVDFVCFCVVL